jgi:hypothetical protein
MTWTTFHRRAEVLREVMSVLDAAADAGTDVLLPMDMPGVADCFGDELALLGALQLRWHTRLAGRIEAELDSSPHDPEVALGSAWRATSRELPGIRAVLDHYSARPLDDEMARAMATAARKEDDLMGRAPFAAA